MTTDSYFDREFDFYSYEWGYSHPTIQYDLGSSHHADGAKSIQLISKRY